jgi:hypothetical protein
MNWAWRAWHHEDLRSSFGSTEINDRLGKVVRVNPPISILQQTVGEAINANVRYKTTKAWGMCNNKGEERV